jgi:hypothetical protein
MSDPQTLSDSLGNLCSELDTYSLEAYQYGERAAKLEKGIFIAQAAFLSTLTKEAGFTSDKLRDAALAQKFPQLEELEFCKHMNKRCLERCDALKTQISAKQSLLKLEIERPR